MTRRYEYLFVLIAPLLLMACAGGQSIPEDRFYRLDARVHIDAAASPVFTDGLVIDPVTADPLRSGRAVVYRQAEKPLQLQRYHYEYWVDQPPRLVGRVLLDTLRESAVADVVYTGGRRTTARYRMTARLLRFEKVVQADSADVELELEVSVTEQGSEQPLWHSVYLERRAGGDRSMHAAAEAMRQALSDVMRRLVNDLEQVDPGY